MSNLFHFYHVYADGAWNEAVEQHLTALQHSGLYDQLDGLFYAVVGSEGRREDVKEFLPGVVVAEADEGWEQVTLNELHDFSQMEDGKVFYAHTKGAWSQSDLATAWRRSMTFDTVYRWEECVSALNDYDAAGAFWLRSREPEHANHKHFFAGNFWWANMSYIQSLPALSDESRFSAEGWIGLNNPRAYVLRDGFSYWGNFYAKPLPFESVEV